MKKRWNRLLGVLLCISLLTCVAVACAKEDGPVANTSRPSGARDTVKTEDPDYVDEIPELDFSDRELKIYMRDNDFYITDMYFEDYSDTISFVDQAVFRRNEIVSERFGGVYYTLGRSPTANHGTELSSQMKAGNCEWDIVITHGHSMTAYARNATLQNFYDVPNLDLTKKYWDQNLIKDFTLKGQLYVLSGDISHQLLGHTDSMVFNKGLCDDLKLDYPYQAVMNGSWTFELFESMIKMANAEKGTDNKLTPEDGDVMGYITDKYCGPINVLYSGGGMVSHNDGETYSLSLYNDRNMTVIERFFELMERENCYIFTNWTEASELVSFRQTYAAGNILFMDLRTYEINDLILSGMTDYGVIPWPKYDSNSPGYRSWVDAGANFIGIPCGKSEDDLSFIGAMLEVLCAEGHREVMPVYYEQILKLKFSQDPQSHEIMDLIKDGRVYDMASYWGSPVGMPGNFLATNTRYTFAQFWDEYGTSAESHATTLNKFFEDNRAK